MKGIIKPVWNEPTSLDDSLSVLTDLALDFTKKGGVTGQTLAGYIMARDWAALCKFELDYNSVCKDGVKVEWDVNELIAVRQVLGFFTKLEDLDIGVDKERAAYDTFRESENCCAEQNRFFRKLIDGSVFFTNPIDNLVFYGAQKSIKRLLGPAPEIGDLRCNFGPGATTSIKRALATPQHKLAEEPSCSSSLLASGLLPEICRSFPHWFENHTEEWWIDDEDYLGYSVDFRIDTGKLEFVPKNASTYRAIDKQPTVNTMIQSGVGKLIAQRLKMYAGVDLKDQTRNQRLARQGSLDGTIATIDLRSASDRICRELVRFLLPEDWYRLLSACRTTSTLYKGEVIELEKFCSMGNGFTFPLESLIFWALTCSAVNYSWGDSTSVSVFGDDILCPSGPLIYGTVVRTLANAGFEVNLKKSFATGPFRESCGGDYFKGIPVRPYYQKLLVSGQTLFTLHNFLVRDNEDAAVVEKVKRYIPRSLRLFGPDGYGDGHLVSDKWPPKDAAKCRKLGWGGVFFETYAAEGAGLLSCFPGDYITPLYTVYVSGREPLVQQLNPDPHDVGYQSNIVAFSGRQTKVTRSGRPIWPVALDGESDCYVKRKVYTFQA